MKKPARRTPFAFDEFRRRRRNHLQYHHYPSQLALDLWEYVLQIGISRCPEGHALTNFGQRRGYLLHYIRRGGLTHEVNGKTYHAAPGHIVLLDFGKGHRQYNKEAATTHLWWLMFDGKDMARTYAELGADYDPLFVVAEPKRIEEYFRELWTLISQPSAAHEPRSHAILHAILGELFAARSQRAPTPTFLARKSLLSDKVRLAVNVIEMNYYMNLGLKQIGAHVKTDPYHLAHIFRQEIGMPPIQYLNRYRVEIGKQMLATTDKTVSEVARLVGIPDESYFARTFRRIAGKTPQAYRVAAKSISGKK